MRRIEQFVVYAGEGSWGRRMRRAQAFLRSAILHDVGKIHVPDVILKKPGPLTAEERDVMQSHTTAGGGSLNGHGYFAAAAVAGHHGGTAAGIQMRLAEAIRWRRGLSLWRMF